MTDWRSKRAFGHLALDYINLAGLLTAAVSWWTAKSNKCDMEICPDQSVDKYFECSCVAGADGQMLTNCLMGKVATLIAAMSLGVTGFLSTTLVAVHAHTKVYHLTNRAGRFRSTRDP